MEDAHPISKAKIDVKLKKIDRDLKTSEINMNFWKAILENSVQTLNSDHQSSPASPILVTKVDDNLGIVTHRKIIKFHPIFGVLPKMNFVP